MASSGDGWAVASLDDMGEGYGFRKVRHELGVTAFGVNAVVLPPGYTSRRHFHEEQEELYFVHSGSLDILFGDGAEQRMEAGTFARVSASTVRALRATEDGPVVYLCVGGKDGYVGRDGKPVED
jgi:uncharacterized cupin superfamily protein